MKFKQSLNNLNSFNWGEPDIFKILNKSFELCPEPVTEKLKEIITV